MNEVSEQTLIDLCKKGDRKAQRAIYDKLAPRMFPLCLRYVCDRNLAEDLLQDGFVTLFSKIGSYKGNGSFDGWARKIFVTTALMYLRRNDAIRQSDDIEYARHLSSESSDQLQDIGYKELMKLIASLPTGFRTVFNLNVIEGYSHKEIGDMLGISEVTSWTELSRARVILPVKIMPL